MKRSEMLQLLYGKLTKELLINKTSVYDSTEKILTFLEEQGMRPPLVKYLTMVGPMFYDEWEQEDER
jgi:uncharacterized membrane protein affecting hemolysin expression